MAYQATLPGQSQLSDAIAKKAAGNVQRSAGQAQLPSSAAPSGTTRTQGAGDDFLEGLKEGWGATGGKLAGGFADTFEDQIASAPYPEEDWWKASAQAEQDLGYQQDITGYAAETGAANINSGANTMLNNTSTAAGQVQNTMTGVGANSQALGYGALAGQQNIASQLGNTSSLLASNAQQAFNPQIGGYGQFDAAGTLRGAGTLGGFAGRADANLTGISDPLRANAAAAQGNVASAGANTGTDRLQNWTQGATGPGSVATSAATGLLNSRADQGTQDQLSRFSSGESGQGSLNAYKPSMAAGRSLADFSVDRNLQNQLAGYNPNQAQLNALARFDPGTTAVGYAGKQSTSGLGSLAGRIANYNGPSEAELQMNSALDKNVAAQFALANSGRGAYSGDAMRRAQASAATLGQDTAAKQAELRAKEWATRMGLAESAYTDLGQIGSAQDKLLQTNEAMRLQKLTDVATGEQSRNDTRLGALQSAATTQTANDRALLDARLGYADFGQAANQQLLEAAKARSDQGNRNDQLRLQALQSAGDLGLGNQQLNLDALTRAAAAGSANDQTQLAYQDQQLNAANLLSSASARDRASITDALNAATSAGQALSGSELGRMQTVGTLRGQADVNDINRAQALAAVGQGLTQSEIDAYLAQGQVQQGWSGQSLQAQNQQAAALQAGYGQALEGAGQNLQANTVGSQAYMDSILQSELAAMNANITAQGMIVDAQGQILGSVQDWYAAEAQREAALYGTYIGAKAQTSMTNAQIDTQRDSGMIGMISAGAGMLGGML